MKKFQNAILFLGIMISISWACHQKNAGINRTKSLRVILHDTLPIIDTTQIQSFFLKYPEFKPYKADVKALYQKHNKYIWFKGNGLTEFAQVLFNQATQLGQEGLQSVIPYRDQYNEIFYNNSGNKVVLNSELLISCLYFYYIKNVFSGLDTEKSQSVHWNLPRETVSYSSLLDSLMIEPGLIKKERPEFFRQYYNLRKALQRFREIEKKGGWNTIKITTGSTSFKPDDTSKTITEVRTRLYIEGYIKSDSGERMFDRQLLEGVSKYQIRHNRNTDSRISPSMISELNIPVSDRIKTISVNMERCRWITPRLIKAKEFIAINIPSYRLHYIRDGKPVLVSKVVVGSELNKTLVFSGELSYIVFNPYWNVPSSILEKEIKPAVRKNKSYLEQHNMEWTKGRLRQRPGKENALGLVKFMFPNSNNIYLHDTPAKSLFNKEDRAFSHGCIRVEKARELAIAIMAKDAGWTQAKVDQKMDGSSEKIAYLHNIIPIYIAYFTAWADDDGNISFYNDVYNRDEDLAKLLHL